MPTDRVCVLWNVQLLFELQLNRLQGQKYKTWHSCGGFWGTGIGCLMNFFWHSDERWGYVTGEFKEGTKIQSSSHMYNSQTLSSVWYVVAHFGRRPEAYP